MKDRGVGGYTEHVELVFQELINSVEAIIWEADFKTSRITYVSQYVQDLLGYPAERWYNDPGLFPSIVHPDDLDLISRAKASVTPRSSRYHVSYRVFKASGEVVYLSDRVSVQFQGDEPAILRGISTDVSERVRVEEALALSVEVTRAASEMDSALAIAESCLTRIYDLLKLDYGRVWFVDKDNSSLENGLRPVSHFTRLAGQSAEEPDARSVNLVDSAARSGTAVFTALEGRFRSGFAFPVCISGELFCVFEFFSCYLFLPNQFLLKALEEISAHLAVVFAKRAGQEQLRIQKEHEEVILDSMPVMVWFKDAHGRILRVNKSGAAIRGMEPQQMAGKTDWELYPDEADEYYADDLEVISSGRPKLGIVEQHLRGDGTKTWVSTDKIPYRDHTGEVRGVIVFASDISKLKEAEEELLAIRQDLESKVAERTKELEEANIYFALSRDLLCIATKDGYFRRLNPSWQQKLGYSLEDLMERPFLSLVHPDDRESTRAAMAHLQQGGYIRNFENRYLRKDGSVCWFLWSASAPADSDLIYAVAYDITDRKEAERELHEISVALKNAVEGIAKIDVEDCMVSVNEAYGALHDVDSTSLIGRCITEFIAPDCLDKWAICRASMLQSGKAVVELTGLKEGGETFHQEVTLVRVDSDSGQFSGYYVFNKDITARTDAELSLRQSEARFHHLASHMPGGIYQYVRRKDGSFYFPYVSPGCGAIIGRAPEELMKNPELLFSILHPEDVPLLNQAIVGTLSSNRSVTFEGRIISGREQRWVHAESTPETLENGDIIFNGLITDITEKKLSEAKIRKLNEDLSERVNRLAAVNKELESLTRKLELAYDAAMEASKVKSEFVANISHEIRTPISAVIGMSELLLDSSLGDEQRQYGIMVRDSAQSLLTIINDILDFSKMEAGHLELEVNEINLLSLVEDSVELLAHAARKKGLSLTTFVSPDLPGLVLGDAVRIRQILLNLTSNAVKFTASGRVLVSVSSSPDNQDLIRFTVSDTGIGLSASTRYKLFNPFFQADGSTTRNYGGTGLGLSICKLLVELMGGSIDFDSEENKGTKFWFDLPLPICAGSDSVGELLTDHVAERGLHLRDKDLDSSAALLVGYFAETLLSLSDILKVIAPAIKTSECLLDVGTGLPEQEMADVETLILDLASKRDNASALNRNAGEAILEDFCASLERSCQGCFGKLKQVFLLVPLEIPAEITAQMPTEMSLELKGPGQIEKRIRQAVLNCLSDAAKENLPTFHLLNKPTKLFDFSESLLNVLNRQGLSSTVLGGEGEAGEPDSENEQTSSALSSRPALAAKARDKVANADYAELSSAKEELVLIAEDNPVMQELALRQLKRLGYRADVVKNGKQAVEALSQRQYALVLMDCQMPEMDGYEATLLIRRQEKGEHHVPIVAMTASAMKGDRENCLASGMDDYLSKPVSQNDLVRVLNKWVSRVANEGETPSSPGSTKTNAKKSPEKNSESFSENFSGKSIGQASGEQVSIAPVRDMPLDIKELSVLYGEEDMPRLVKSFLEECESLLRDLGDAITRVNSEEISRQAHQLKGLAVVMTAFDLSQAALALERSASKRSEEILPLFCCLQEEFARVKDYLFQGSVEGL